MITPSHLSVVPVQELLGGTEQHVQLFPLCSQVKVNTLIVEPLQNLISAAETAGFELRIASGFRSFERQSSIWNRKCCGQLDVLNSDGVSVDIDSMNPWEKVQTILRWSAFPGTSRHHWGTECDIFDAAAIDEGYQLQLHPDEYAPGGIFGDLMAWLQDYLQHDGAPDFFFPYQYDCGGVMPEPWHISYRPVAANYEKNFSVALLKEYLEGLSMEKQLAEQEIVLEHLDEIYERFIRLKE